MNRPYQELLAQVKSFPDRRQAMQAFVDLLWPALHPTGVSWLGFYLHEGGEELILGPRRDKPACSPIGMHGVCGQSFRGRKPMVIRDVLELGEDYVACDPRDRSEVVVPLLEADGTCYGVLDLDSFEVGAFSQDDADGLARLLRRAGLTA